jgi:DNA-nicking Smr family endonuclease
MKDEDADARAEFERAMTDVVRLPRDPRGRVRTAPAPGSGLRPPSVAPPRSQPGDADAPPDAFAAPGVDRREIRRLKRGEYPVDAELDLHGSSAAEALALLDAFIHANRRARRRAVSIVHGRGLNSAGGVAVLKREVRTRLMTMPEVLAYAAAPASADGATYVLLRR